MQDRLKRAAADAKEREKQLCRSQKMDALATLTGTLTHDYNNILGVVIGYAELLESTLTDKPESLEFANEITRAAHRGATLSKKLLSFSKQRVSDAKILNLNSVLRSEQSLLEKTLTTQIKLNFDLSDDLWEVNLDIAEFKEAIVNMSMNAMHAIEAQGELTIQTQNEVLDEADAAILQIESGDYVSLSLTDTGSGMDEQTQDKLFEPFYTTKKEVGAGLGLNQVYGFVSRSSGAIKVYSEIDQGSRFILYFPRYLGS